jgi:hypothetical protein
MFIINCLKNLNHLNIYYEDICKNFSFPYIGVFVRHF